jgi:Icc-related predicted phosphoesterase
LNLCTHGERVGCEELLQTLQRVQPKIHAFGHIHEGYGILEQNGTIFINASVLNERYQVRNPPIVVEI